MANTRAEVKEVFSRIAKGKLEEQAEEFLYQLAVEFGIVAKDLGNKWDSFTLNKKIPDPRPTMETLKLFQQHLKEKHKPSHVVKKEKDRPVLDKATMPKTAPQFDLDELLDYVPKSDAETFQENRRKLQEAAQEEQRRKQAADEAAARQKRIKAEQQPASSAAGAAAPAASSKFDVRTKRGETKASHNAALPNALAAPAQVAVEEISAVRYLRCMNNTFDAMSAYLEGRLKRLGETALADNKLTPQGLLERPSQEEIVSYGRICCEQDHTPTDKSFIIEGTVHGIKPRMPIDMSDVEVFSVFAGQIAAVKGINNSKRFIASQIVPPLPLPHRPPPTEGLSLLVAAGPFAFGGATNYEPLHELLRLARTSRPSAIILLGPFVSLDTPGIAPPDPTLELTFEELFTRECVKPLRTLGVQVFLVPHVRDAHHMFPYPQPPFDSDGDESVHMVSNPAVIGLNGLSVGVTSVDIVSVLVREEIAKGMSPDADRMARLYEHLLQQQSFYPVHPPWTATCADVSLMHHAEFKEHTPHVLISPSLVKPFVKVVSGTVCINPGILVHNESAGTYASIVLHPKKEGGSGGSETVAERLRVEVIRI